MRRSHVLSGPRLFRLRDEVAVRLKPRSHAREKDLQQLFQRHLPTLLGVRSLATEYVLGRSHGGRIDTLGIDDRAAPVVIEYKRRPSPQQINQGLYYLDWLQDHRADYQMLVSDRLGPDAPSAINWSMPRLISVAPGFSRYDLPALRQARCRIDLVTYRWFGRSLLLLDTLGSGSDR